MRRLLVISNGHGEIAIAERIAATLLADGKLSCGREPFALDHLPLVGTGRDRPDFVVVGPRAAMPSGGLVAMGNVRAFAGDLAAGFARLFAAQVAFARRVRYDGVVAVGDAYALGFAGLVRATVLGRRGATVVAAPAVFVGTAKSVAVAPYGPGERRLLGRARRIFVRDLATAEALVRAGVPAEAPGNVIVDLLSPSPGQDATSERETSAPGVAASWIAVLPGSRERAYADAVRLLAVARELAVRSIRLPGDPRAAVLVAVCSVAPGLSPERFVATLRAEGFAVTAPREAGALVFVAEAPGLRVEGRRGALGPIFAGAALALGQAGTANEQAAGAGVPVVALDGPPGERRTAGERWYRMRQQRLLGRALALVPAERLEAAAAIAELLADGARLAAMRAAGPERMGGPGGAAAIAAAIRAELLDGAP